MDAYPFRVEAGRSGAHVSGKKVRSVPRFPGRRLCRIRSEPLVAARIKAVLLAGASFLGAERVTSVPDSSIVRHCRECLDKETQDAIESIRRAKPYRGTKMKPLQAQAK
jgi:hypothetical protein